MAAAGDPLPPRALRGDGLLIFATVGTHHQPFDRFVRIALTLARDEQLVVQHGHTARVGAGPSVQYASGV